MDMRRKTALIAFALAAAALLAALASVSVYPGVNGYYNGNGYKIAPNMVTLIVFDYRGYDTLGECVILVAGVLALSALFGRGLLAGDVHDTEEPAPAGTLVLRMFTPAIMALTAALGVYVALGGHITPGGGFQGGSIIGAGVLLSLVVLGAKSVKASHTTLVKLEAAGLMLYISLGLAGLLYSGYFLYNVGSNVQDIVPAGVASLFAYPDGLNAGIIPYLNVSVLIKVSAGLTTAMVVLLGAKR